MIYLMGAPIICQCSWQIRSTPWSKEWSCISDSWRTNHLEQRLNIGYSIAYSGCSTSYKSENALNRSAASINSGHLEWLSCHLVCISFASERREFKFYNPRASVFTSLAKESGKTSKKNFRLHAESPKRSWWKEFLFKPIAVDDVTFDDKDSETNDDGKDSETNNEMDSDTKMEDEFDFRSYTQRPKGPWWRQLFNPISMEDIPLDDASDGSKSEDSEKESPNEETMDEIDRMLADDKAFAAWKRKNDALNELREYQESGLDPDSTDWEDWLDNSWKSDDYIATNDSWYQPQKEWEKDGLPREPPKMPERGMSRSFKELLLRTFEDQEQVEEELQFEARIFEYAFRSTAIFVGVLIFVPWLIDFLIHDYAILPFLERYVEKVPLAGQLLDVRESQKLKIVHSLKLEEQRVKMYAEIGKAPPLIGDELDEHLHEKALELRDEWRLENRSAFGNLFSDAIAGIVVLLLLVFNPEQVALLRLTGDRLFTNISDTGKAFIIILLSDIFLGYHSESGWETVIEMFLEHYGLEASQESVYIFIAIVPVTIDAYFKLWVFKSLPKISPSAAATFKEMSRH